MQQLRIYILVLPFFFALSCSLFEEPDPPQGLSDKVSITCDSISDITLTSAIVYGTVSTSVLSSAEVGISWSDDSLKGYDKNMLAFNIIEIPGSFSLKIDSFSNKKTYYVKTWCNKNNNLVYSVKYLNFCPVNIAFRPNDPDTTGRDVALSGKIKNNIILNRLGYCYSSFTSLPGINDSIVASKAWNEVRDDFESYSFEINDLEPGLYNARVFAETISGFVVYSQQVLTFSIE